MRRAGNGTVGSNPTLSAKNLDERKRTPFRLVNFPGKCRFLDATETARERVRFSKLLRNRRFL